MDHLMRMPLNCLRNLVDWRVSGETFGGRSSARQRFSKAPPLSGEGYTINNDLEPANPRGQLMLAESLVMKTSCSVFLALCQKSSGIELGMKVEVLNETEPESPLKWYQAGGFDSL